MGVELASVDSADADAPWILVGLDSDGPGERCRPVRMRTSNSCRSLWY